MTRPRADRTLKTFEEFVRWEKVSEAIAVKRLYIDMTAPARDYMKSSLPAGILLSQIVYYHLPSHNSPNKLDVLRAEQTGGVRHWWLVRQREDWWNECRLSPSKYSRAIKVLVERDLVIVRLWKHNKTPTHHLRINPVGFMERLREVEEDIMRHHYSTAKATLTKRENQGIPTLTKRESPMTLTKRENSPSSSLTKDKNHRILTKDENDLYLYKSQELGINNINLSFNNLPVREIWSVTLDELKMQMTRATYNQWLSRAELIGVLVDNELIKFVVSFPNQYAIDWVSNRLMDTIIRTLSAICGQNTGLVPVVLTDEERKIIRDNLANQEPVEKDGAEQSPLPETEPFSQSTMELKF